MKSVRQRVAELDCVFARASSDGAADRVAVFCHGFGAPGDDLVGLAAELVRCQPQALRQTEFVFPAAPIELDWDVGFDGRAWWPINMAALQDMALRGDLSDMAAYVPPQLQDCRVRLERLIADRRQAHRLESGDCYVGGFSQGAMLAVDVALHQTDDLGGLVIWSGAVINRENWTLLAAGRSPMRVVQSHGQLDPILPFAAGVSLRDLLTRSGHHVEFLPFAGPHTISGAAIEAAAAMIASPVVGQ